MRSSCARLALALVLSSCGSSELVRFSVPAEGPEVGLWIELGEDGSFLRASAPFGLGDNRFGTPSLELAAGEPERAVLLGLELGAIEALAPGIEPAGVAALSVVVGLPLAGSPFEDPIVAAFPESTRAWRIAGTELRVEADVAAITTKLQLRIPSNPEFCRTSFPHPIEPFGAAAYYFSSDLTPSPSTAALVYEVKHIVAVDDDTILGATATGIFVAERGGRLEPSDVTGTVQTKLLAIANSALPEGAEFNSVALAPIGREGPRRAWACGTYPVPGPSARGFLLELTYGDKHVSLVGTASIAGINGPDALLPLNRMTYDDDGNLIVVGPGTLIVQRPGERVFRTVPYAAELPQVGLDDVAASHDPTEPHLIVPGVEGILSGDARTGALRLTELVTPFDAPPGDGRAARRVMARADGAERWAVGTGGLFQRWTASTGWSAVVPRFSPASAPCTGGLNYRLAAPTFTAIAIADRDLFVLPQDCLGVLAFDTTRDCVATLALPDAPIARDRRHTTSAIIVGRAVIIGGYGGQLYRLPL